MKQLVVSMILPILIALVLSLARCASALAISPASANASTSKLLDCSREYGGHPAACERIPCDNPYRSFLGVWRGAFHAYVRSKSTAAKTVYRPYRDRVRYSASDCLENPKTGETFIVGHQTDRYPAFEGLPAKVETSLLIIGRHADGKPFLRTVSNTGVHTFSLVYRNDAASLSIWRLRLPAAHGAPPMTFTTIDGRRPGAANRHARNVTVTLAVGPASAPYWRGVIVWGSHARR